MKYTSGGITVKIGQMLIVEVPVPGTPPAKPPAALKAVPAPVSADDPTKDLPFVEGVDVSSSQNPASINWNTVFKSGRRFMYAQMGMTPEALKQGHADEDKAGRKHIPAAHAAGLWVGAYQYAYFNHDPIRDADLLLKSIDGLPINLPLMIDAEQPRKYWHCSPAEVVNWLRKWVAHVEQVTGRRPVVYSGEWWNQLQEGGRSAEWAAYPFWVANYNQVKSPPVPRPWTGWNFWQYGGNSIWQKNGQQAWGPKAPGPDWSRVGIPGTCPGIPGELDVDRFNGNLAAFEAWANGGAPQSPVHPSGVTPTEPPDKPPALADKPTARPDYPLLPEDMKARYLSMSFNLDGEQVDISLPHLRYQNLKLGLKLPNFNEPGKNLIVRLFSELKQGARDLLEELTGTLAKGGPAFVMHAFGGKGSPEQIQAVLKLAGHFKTRLGKEWQDKGSLSASLASYYWANMGLDCSGFAGNYARAVGGTKLEPNTPIPQFAPPQKRRRKLDEILPGDLIIWASGGHIATIQGRRSEGHFDIVESNDEPEVQGLGNTIRELKETGGDSMQIRKLHTNGTWGRVEEVYVATIK
jgi:GH25 family lysozyme M1 (1,4-beta-N-acetylmuramidase)